MKIKEIKETINKKEEMKFNWSKGQAAILSVTSLVGITFIYVTGKKVMDEIADLTMGPIKDIINFYRDRKENIIIENK